MSSYSPPRQTWYANLVRNSATPCRWQTTWYVFHRSLHSRQFSSKRVVSWHSQPVATLAHAKSFFSTHLGNTVPDNPATAIDQDKQNKIPSDAVRVARHIVLQHYTQHHVLVRTNTNGLLTIEPRGMSIRYHRTLAARGNISIPLRQPFYIFVSNTSDRQKRLPKIMIIAECSLPPDVIHATKLDDEGLSPPPRGISISRIDISTKLRTDISAVHYRPASRKRFQMLYHASVQNDGSSRLAQNWWDEVHLSDKYSAYDDEFICMPTELQSMWDSHLDRISVAKHRIEFIDEMTQPEH